MSTAACPSWPLESTTAGGTTTSRGFLNTPDTTPLGLLTGGQVEPYAPDTVSGVADVLTAQGDPVAAFDFDPFGNPRTGRDRGRSDRDLGPGRGRPRSGSPAGTRTRRSATGTPRRRGCTTRAGPVQRAGPGLPGLPPAGGQPVRLRLGRADELPGSLGRVALPGRTRRRPGPQRRGRAGQLAAGRPVRLGGTCMPNARPATGPARHPWQRPARRVPVPPVNDVRLRNQS